MRTGFVVLLAGGFVFGAVPQAEAASFRGLGFLGGGEYNSSGAWGISPDGSVVVGESSSGDGAQAFRWTAAGGMQGLGNRSGPAFSASAKGAAIVGNRYYKEDGTAYLWTEAGGIESLGVLGNENYSWVGDVSADGEVVVGVSRKAFRWTRETGMESLGTLGGAFSAAYGITSDGAVIVGTASTRTNGDFPFRWTESEGMVSLGNLTGEKRNRRENAAYDVTPDGRVIVGSAEDKDQRQQPFRWTEEDGMVGLGMVSSENLGIRRAVGVSADGSLVVGYEYGVLQDNRTIAIATIWDAEHEIRSLEDALVADYGLDLAGWKLNAANGISNDGTRIVGDGINPDGQLEGWIATIPEPGTGVLILGALLMLRRR